MKGPPRRHLAVTHLSWRWESNPRVPLYGRGAPASVLRQHDTSSERQDSNLRLPRPERGALTKLSYFPMVGMAGVEPTISCPPDRRDNQASLHSDVFYCVTAFGNLFLAYSSHLYLTPIRTFRISTTSTL